MIIPIILTVLYLSVATCIAEQTSGHVVNPGLLLYGVAILATLLTWAIYGLVRLIF